MNIVDYVILGLLGVSVLFGLYRGFIASVLNTGGCLAAFGLSFYLSPKLAALVQGNATLQDTLGHYADVSSRLGDLDLALMSVQDAVRQGGDMISNILSRVDLPAPIAALLEANLTTQSAAGMTVQDAISQTILSACVNILCFVVCFAVLYLAVSLVVNLLKAVFHFPVLKQLDGLAGGIFGLLRGALICFVLMALVPLAQTVVPLDIVTDLINQSTLAPFFTGNNLISIITGL